MLRHATIAAVVLMAVCGMGWTAGTLPAAKPTVSYDESSGQVKITNGRLELIVDTAKGINPHGLRDIKGGRVYADADYGWPDGKKPVPIGDPLIETQPDGGCRVTVAGIAGDLRIELVYGAPADEPNTITETVRLQNVGQATLDTSQFACGFSRKAGDDGSRFCNIPYRIHNETGESCDYTIGDLISKQSWYSITRSPMFDRQNSAIWGAEGWAWYRGNNTLLITKYNPDAMEWSLIAPMQSVLRFGGAGRWKLGDPQAAASLALGGVFTFGTTRYQIVDGGWKEAYAAFRQFTESKGHRVPANYNPPVHWNELYDNQLWWVGDSLENRTKYYERADMEAEAAVAKDLGCECLYLDPGWDTTFGSNIWSNERLGPEAEFAKWLKDTYGFALALHTPLAPWTDAAEYPVEARRMDRAGHRLGDLCVASPAYMDTKIARLTELYRNGAYFFMYDGSWFPGECWDPTHGHSLPITHQEHIDAILRLAQKLHQACPTAVIEQHDPMTGPGTPRYVPTYFMHGKPGAFDELWGYEYMIDPMDDITSRRAISLYYVNLAYSIPIYLHIDLRKDNANALMLWWYMSTCRHLGVGGKSSDPAIWSAQKAAMRTYLAHKRFYTQGVFYGLDETVHVHTLADVNEAVIDVFNFTDKTEFKKIKFRRADVGLNAGKVGVQGAVVRQDKGTIYLTVPISAKAHELVKISLVAHVK